MSRKPRRRPTEPPTTILTTAELDALPTSSVVDATVTGARVRAMLSETGEWHMSAYLDGSRVALSRDLKDAVLVTDAPIQPAPIKPLPLPTEPGARFWGRTSSSEPTWWFVHSVGFRGQHEMVRYVSSAGLVVPSQGVGATHGLVRLPEPDATEVTS